MKRNSLIKLKLWLKLIYQLGRKKHTTQFRNTVFLVKTELEDLEDRLCKTLWCNLEKSAIIPISLLIIWLSGIMEITCTEPQESLNFWIEFYQNFWSSITKFWSFLKWQLSWTSCKITLYSEAISILDLMEELNLMIEQSQWKFSMTINLNLKSFYFQQEREVKD